MVCGDIVEDMFYLTNVNLSDRCRLRVKASIAFCIKYGQGIHGRCEGVMMTKNILLDFEWNRCEGSLVHYRSPEERMCDKV